MPSAAVTAVYQSPAEDDRWIGLSLEEMIYEATTNLLTSSHLSPKDIDYVSLACSDGLDGRAISPMVTAASVAGYGKPLVNSASSSEHALVLACMRILSGLARIVLVCSWSKPSEAQMGSIESLTLEPFFHRGLPLSRVASLAIQASAYVNRDSLSSVAADAVLSKNRLNASRNPIGLLAPERASPISEEEPFAAWPIRAADLPVPIDRVVGMIVTDDAVAGDFGKPFAIMEGMGWSIDTYWKDVGSLTDLTSVRRAVRSASDRAGLSRLWDAVDAVELTDASTYHELMAYEALGLCLDGEGPHLALSGETALRGRLPVNPSGGLQAGYPAFATGLDRAAEAIKQVMGEAGDCQVSPAGRALSQSFSGLGVQASTVFIFRGEA
jgi:acetyl-CoA C-acetyltransferase